MGAPVFDVVIELNKADRNAWTIIEDVGQAVDDILEGDKYKVDIHVTLAKPRLHKAT
jgi:hypothetical protein